MTSFVLSDQRSCNSVSLEDADRSREVVFWKIRKPNLTEKCSQGSRKLEEEDRKWLKYSVREEQKMQNKAAVQDFLDLWRDKVRKKKETHGFTYFLFGRSDLNRRDGIRGRSPGVSIWFHRHPVRGPGGRVLLSSGQARQDQWCYSLLRQRVFHGEFLRFTPPPWSVPRIASPPDVWLIELFRSYISLRVTLIIQDSSLELCCFGWIPLSIFSTKPSTSRIRAGRLGLSKRNW